MKPPLFVRELTPAERTALRRGLRSPDAFTLRRAQVLLASADRRRAAAIAADLGCAAQTVRDAIRAFHARGVGCLGPTPKGPKAARRSWPRERDADLTALLHLSPRTLGKPTSLWTLALVATVAHEKGWTDRVLSGEAIRRVLKRLAVGWKRAKHWVTSPDPAYAAKKRRDDLIAAADASPDWVLGFQDEVWWSRLAQPDLSSWSAGDPARLRPPARGKGDGPAAVACYGILRRDTGGMMLRFVAGRPVSQVTEDFLGWACGAFAAEGKTVFALVWDNAAWHVSKRVVAWIAAHNERVGRDGGCRIEVCGLPVKAPWLNPIEPKWAHGKRAVAEPDRKLTADELTQRVYDYYGCPAQPPIEQDIA